MRPNQPLTVKIKASTKNGEKPKQVNVLVSAVDSGVLNITGYVTPDPWQAFFGQKRYGADIYDIYGQVIEGQGRLAALRFGGDGDELKRGGKPPVNHVNIVAQQALPVTLNEQGEGSVALPIGDFNGELRVMAQAWTADDFGSNESKVIVAAPVIAELNMPRFMASGDTSRLTLDITNLTDKPQKLNVALTASGLLELVSDSPAAVELAPGVRTTLFIPVRALTGFGDGDIQATISGLALPGETVADQHKQWKIGVRPAFPAQTVNYGTALQPGEMYAVHEYLDQLENVKFVGIHSGTLGFFCDYRCDEMDLCVQDVTHRSPQCESARLLQVTARGGGQEKTIYALNEMRIEKCDKNAADGY